MTKTETAAPRGRVLGVFGLAMINLAVICTLRGLPILAEEGLSLIFYYAVAAVVFLIPVSLVTAELATGWPPSGPGGVYVWVREAFGERCGFLAVWLQWIQNVIWFPAVLSFLGATLAYVFDPSLAANKFYMVSVILVVYWAGTFASFRGMKTSGAISAVGVIAGVVIPGILAIILCGVWLATGKGAAIAFTWRGMVPDLTDVNKVALLAGAVLIFSGIEVSAVHAPSVRDPKRTYPRATFIAAGIALAMLVLGSLAIAIVVPQREISLVAGIMQAFTIFLDKFGLRWLIPAIAILISAGSIGEISSWIVGPSKGLYSTVARGDLPRFFHRVNPNGVPTRIIFVQASVVSVLALVFLLMPSVSASYWILSALCVHLYLVMYILLYLAALRLRYAHPEVPRAYMIPGGKPGVWLVTGVGVAGAVFAMAVGFFPPAQIRTGGILFYEAFLAGGTLLMVAVPLLISLCKKPSWMAKAALAFFCLAAAAGSAFASECRPCRDVSWWDARYSRKTATGDWQGARTRLEDAGVTLAATYTTDVGGNVTGGLKRAAKYAGCLWGGVTFNFEKIASLKGVSLKITNCYLTGRDLSGAVGAFYGIQEVYSTGNYFFGELDLSVALFDDTLVIETGRIFAGDIFAVSPVFQYYVTSAVNGRLAAIPSNVFFPHYQVATWGVRTTFQPTSDWHLITGIYNADPAVGKPANHGMGFSFEMDEGYLAVGQLTYRHGQKREEDALPGSVSVGTYYVSSRFTDLADPSKRWHGNYGLYALVDQMIWKGEWPEHEGPAHLAGGASIAEWHRAPHHQQMAHPLDRPKGLTAWFGAVLCPQDHINTQTYEIATGLMYQGLPPGRDRDVTAFLFAVGHFSDELDGQSEEMVLELNHRFQPAPWFYLTPDIQYIIHPDGRHDVADALVLGFEACCAF